MSEVHDFRSLHRRRVYLGEGLRFALAAGDVQLATEAVDMSPDGLGMAVLTRGAALPAVGERVIVRPAASSGAAHAAIVRHVGRIRALPRLGLALVPDT